MDFKGCTQYNGANGTTGLLNYFQYNLIETMEIKIGGQTRRLINIYGYIYSILNDYTTGTDATNENRIGKNADPSCKYFYTKSGI